MDKGKQVGIDISQTTDVVCPACGNFTFEPVIILRRVSKLLSPTGEEALVPLDVVACNACGQIPAQLLPPFLREKPKEAKTGEIKSSLSIVKD